MLPLPFEDCLSHSKSTEYACSRNVMYSESNGELAFSSTPHPGLSQCAANSASANASSSPGVPSTAYASKRPPSPTDERAKQNCVADAGSDSESVADFGASAIGSQPLLCATCARDIPTENNSVTTTKRTPVPTTSLKNHFQIACNGYVSRGRTTAITRLVRVTL